MEISWAFVESRDIDTVGFEEDLISILMLSYDRLWWNEVYFELEDSIKPS